MGMLVAADQLALSTTIGNPTLFYQWLQSVALVHPLTKLHGL